MRLAVILLTALVFLSTGLTLGQLNDPRPIMPQPTPYSQTDLPENASLVTMAQQDVQNVNVTGQPASFYIAATQNYIDDKYDWSLISRFGYSFSTSDRGHSYLEAGARDVPIAAVDRLLGDEASGFVSRPVAPYYNGMLMHVCTREDLQGLMRFANSPGDFDSWPAKSVAYMDRSVDIKFVSIGPEIPITGTDGLPKMTCIVTVFRIPDNNQGYISKESLYYMDGAFFPYRLGSMVF